MSSLQPRSSTPRFVPLLELCVPAFSFGGVLLALFASALGSTVDVRWFGTGCVIASFILAYLAYIRPHKDIVSLTMPIYSVIFFLVPSDLGVDVVLIILYAVSLTILLVRLKRRFGDASVRGLVTLDEDLQTYVDRISPHLAGTDPAVAHSAAIAFLRFSCADYAQAAAGAGDALTGLEGSAPILPALKTAFAIVEEQALLFESSAQAPLEFCDFSPDDAPLVVRPLSENENPVRRFETALDNALLLLFAAGWIASEQDRTSLQSGMECAGRLLR